ncbi:MAG TPA: type II toxin-antitoxin system VapC family toxin [Blastocatellia bacterium]|nr:type II toxin-antitoxin system VapC family toxin [Blastocatellia bacterium]
MLYLTDTNVLLRLAEPRHPMHAAAQNAINTLVTDNNGVCVIPQNIIEFCNVATRQVDQNGLGFTHQQTLAEVEKIERLFLLIPDTPAIYGEWKRLVFAYSVSGRQVHDARIAAAMNIQGITHLLTFNKDDFKRFTGIVAVSPVELPPPPQSAQP